MWYKLFLLLVYLLLLFLLARALELFSWLETGLVTDRILDPATLSVGKLKALLDSRGVSYETVVEKKELEDLVEVTGAITEDDLDASNSEENSCLTNFTNGHHFYEEVEDKKDSVWLVQVRVDHMTSLVLSDNQWKSVRKKLSIFDIRSGMFDCTKDWRFCQLKGWTTSRLVLAYPANFQSKSNVVLNTYSGPTKPNQIYNWVKGKLNEQIRRLRNFAEIQQKWLGFSPGNSEIRLLILSQLSTLPMFFTALSFKFPGRVRFGTVDTSTKEGKDILKRLKLKKSPAHLVVTPEKVHIYGSRPGEALTFRHMERFLKFIYPEVNDLFLLSLFICNSLSCLELVLSQGGLLRRFLNVFWCFVKYNMIVLLLWLPLLGIFQLPVMRPVIEMGLKCIRLINNTHTASLIRKDYFLYSMKWTLLLATAIPYAFIVGFVEYKKTDASEADEQQEQNEWDFSNFRTLSHLFTPLSRRHVGFGMFMYVGMEEQGGVVDGNSLWPSNINTSYINQLPSWVYREEVSMSEQPNMPEANPITLTGQETESSQDGTSENMPYSLSENSSESSLNGNSSVCTNSASKFPCPQCAICLDVYRPGVWVCGLPCGHVFHKPCIMTWLTSDNHICPLCRWPAFKPKVCQLHLHTE